MNRIKKAFENVFLFVLSLVVGAITLAFLWYSLKNAFVVKQGPPTNARYFKTFLDNRRSETVANDIIERSKASWPKGKALDTVVIVAKVNLAACLDDKIKGWLNGNDSSLDDVADEKSTRAIFEPMVEECVNKATQAE
jgi:hypothetical protein